MKDYYSEWQIGNGHHYPRTTSRLYPIYHITSMTQSECSKRGEDGKNDGSSSSLEETGGRQL